MLQANNEAASQGLSNLRQVPTYGQQTHFSEQYEKSDDGIVPVRDKRKISAKSV